MFGWKRLATRLSIAAALSGAGALVILEAVPKLNETRRIKALHNRPKVPEELTRIFSQPFRTRDENLRRIASGEIFDVLVIGGGATGTGVALDAASRGLSTCLVEKFDFASGASSRSTKLIHGGVRYLQKAVFNLDLEQFRMVNEALQERANLIDIAPHLARPLPIMLPVYSLWKLPYFWAGIKLYDLISWTQILRSSYYLNKIQVLERFPLLKGDKLVGGLVYYDGQHEDARMCLSVALTATRYNAAINNYVEVLELLKDSALPTKQTGDSINVPLTGARVRDRLTGKEFVIQARCIINATGAYTDSVRQMDDKEIQPICQPSAGVHIILPGYYCPSNMGLLDPSTSDGRVIFFLPWLNFSLAGTTDTPCEPTHHPAPTERDVGYILDEIRDYLSPEIQVRRGDILSAWSGIRPLVRDPNSKTTQAIARNHVIEVSPSRLITIAGGKWTTYRSMAEETVDKAIEVCGLNPQRSCQTKGLLLEGAHQWYPNLFIQLVQEYGLDVDIARHLTGVYGDKALDVANLANLTGMRWPILGKRLHPEFPFIEAEVEWACQEYAVTAVDFLARRTRLAFLNVLAAQETLPRIVELMGAKLGWTDEKKRSETADALAFLDREMGLRLPGRESVPLQLTMVETDSLLKRFRKADVNSKGFLTLRDLKQFCEQSGENFSDESIQSILVSMDLNRNGQVDLAEFLQFMSALKSGTVSYSPIKHVLKRPPLPVHRSGGGV